jgi:Stf0 sulphotransferase.
LDNYDHPHIKAVGCKIFYDQLTKREFLCVLKELRLRPDCSDHPLNDAVSGLDLDAFAEKLQGLSSFLQSNAELRVIHLKRRNILRAHLSLCMAMRTGCYWTINERQASDSAPLELSYPFCCRAFERTRADELKYDDFFKDHSKLDVFYEDLVDNRRAVLREIFDLLDVPESEVSSEMKKQNSGKMSDLILNYWELKEQFKGSPWEHFFED